MRLSIFATLVAVTSFALAGCAVDGTEESEQTADTQQTAQIGDNRLNDAVQSDNNYVVNGPQQKQVSSDLQRRIYDFSQVPRVGDRAKWEVNLQQVENAAIIPHSSNANVAGRIGNNVETKCGVACNAN